MSARNPPAGANIADRARLVYRGTNLMLAYINDAAIDNVYVKQFDGANSVEMRCRGRVEMARLSPAASF